MNRRQVFKSVAAGAFAVAFHRNTLSACSFADTPEKTAQPTPTPNPLQVAKIAGDLSLIAGAGGNIAVLKGTDSIIVVDTGLPDRIADVQQAIASISSAPPHVVINTHWHYDHTGGNEVLGKAGARFLAHDNTRKRISVETRVEAFNRTFPAQPKIALPILTFSESQTFYTDNEEIHMFYVPPAHTDTDIAVHFLNTNVLHAGDLFFNGFYPFIDYSTKGWLGGMVAAKAKMLSVIDAQTKVIPGHGPLATRDDLKATHDMLATIYERLEKFQQHGQGVDGVIAAKPTADFDAKWGHGMFNGDAFTRNAYTGMLRHKGDA